MMILLKQVGGEECFGTPTKTLRLLDRIRQREGREGKRKEKRHEVANSLLKEVGEEADSRPYMA